MANTLVKTIAACVLAFWSRVGHMPAHSPHGGCQLELGRCMNVCKYLADQSKKRMERCCRCPEKARAVINPLDIAGQPDWKEKADLRHKWCEVWHDLVRDGNFVTVWIYECYITPR